MKKQLEYKLQEFADIRKFANGLQRKELIDGLVRTYLNRRCRTLNEQIESYNFYKENYESCNFKITRNI